jgi:glycosyltransferase involved in cell wall biosynthesis
MKISIVTVVYNRAQTIGRAIESVLSQTYPNIEYIVVDGASTDGTMDEIKKYQDKIDVVISERDAGIYDALNKGVGCATGEIIGFLHSDDYLLNDNIIQQVADGFVKNLLVDLIHGDISFFQSENPAKVTRVYRGNFFQPWMMRFAMQPAHPTVYVRTNFFKEVGLFDLTYKISADFDWLFRAIWKHRAKTKYLPVQMIKMQQGGASTEGWTAIMKHNREDLAILKSHGVFSCWPFIFLKFAFKIFQLKL